MWLRQLASENVLVRERALRELSGAICYQGMLCPATAYAIPFLLEIIQEPAVPYRAGIVAFLDHIFSAEPLEKESWYANPAIAATWDIPVTVEFKDAHAEIAEALPVYIRLLQDADPRVRVQVAILLLSFVDEDPALPQTLRDAYDHEQDPLAQAGFMTVLEDLFPSVSEARDFFAQVVDTHQHELVVFAAALVFVRVEPEGIPFDVVQLLSSVVIEMPAVLSVYKQIPGSDKAFAWEAAIYALYNVAPASLQNLVPLLLKALAQADSYRASSLTQFLLFILLQRLPGADQASEMPTPAELSVDLRNVLTLICERSDVWGGIERNSWNNGGFSRMLAGYNLPESREALAGYLGITLPDPDEKSIQQSVDPLNLYAQRIQAVYPDLQLQSMSGNWPFRSVEVNGSLIFHFPVVGHVQELVRESRLLSLLQGRVPLPVPDPVYVHAVLDDQQVFMGYEKLRGRSLEKELLEGLNNEAVSQALARQMALFLNDLHHLPVAELAGLQLPTVYGRDSLQVLYRRVQYEIFPRMLPDDRTRLTNDFERFLANKANFAFTPGTRAW